MIGGPVLSLSFGVCVMLLAIVVAALCSIIEEREDRRRHAAFEAEVSSFGSGVIKEIRSDGAVIESESGARLLAGLNGKGALVGDRVGAGPGDRWRLHSEWQRGRGMALLG